MKILKRENWWAWLLMLLFSNGTSSIVLGALLDVYDKDSWYANKKNWIIGFCCFIIPGIIMLTVFLVQIVVLTADKLKVKGSEYYLSPYVWLLLMIVPIIGWSLLILLILYLEIWTIVALYKGEAEKYIK